MDADKERLESLTCPVCHDVFNDPVAFPECSHKLCRKCYDQLLEGEDHKVTCPICMSQYPRGSEIEVDRDFRHQLDIFKSEHNLKYKAIEATQTVVEAMASNLSRCEFNVEQLQLRKVELQQTSDKCAESLAHTENLFHQAVQKYFHSQKVELKNRTDTASSKIERHLEKLQQEREKIKMVQERICSDKIQAHANPMNFVQDILDKIGIQPERQHSESDVTLLSRHDTVSIEDIIDEIKKELFELSGEQSPSITIPSWELCTENSDIPLSVDLKDLHDIVRSCDVTNNSGTDTRLLTSAVTISEPEGNDALADTEDEKCHSISSSTDHAKNNGNSRPELETPGEALASNLEEAATHKSVQNEDDKHNDGVEPMEEDIAVTLEATSSLTTAHGAVAVTRNNGGIHGNSITTAEIGVAVSRIAFVDSDLWVIPKPSKGIVMVYDATSGNYREDIEVTQYDKKSKRNIACNVLSVTQCRDGDVVIACRGFSVTVSMKLEIGLLEIDSDGTIIGVLLREKIMDVTSTGNHVYALLERGEIRHYRKKDEKWERLREIALDNKNLDRIIANETHLFLSTRYNQTLSSFNIYMDSPACVNSPEIKCPEGAPVSLYLCCICNNGQLLVADQINNHMLTVDPDSLTILSRDKCKFTPLDAVLDVRGTLWILGCHSEKTYSLHRISHISSHESMYD